MNKRKITIVTMLAFLMLLGVGLTGQASALTTLPDPTSYLDPTDLVPAALPYGDFYSYSLPVLQYFLGSEYSVKSTPGAIKDGIVIYTGASGKGLNTNFPGMDNAYPTPSGTNTIFSTGDVDDPGGDGQFTGDTLLTWDTTLSALDTYLDGNGLYFFFNHNEDNGAANQDLLAWGRVSIVDTTGNPTNPTMYYELNNNTKGPLDYSVSSPLIAPNEPTLDSDGNIQYDSPGIPTEAYLGDYAYAPGEIIIPPVTGDTINQNLGADEAAYALFSPEINENLAGWMVAGYDAMQIEFRLAALSNGYEQLFILPLEDTTPVIPEPATMLLLGSGLIGLAGFSRKKFKKHKSLDI